MTIDTRYLQTFRTVAERGSFTAAAGVLGLTQSAVSQQMRALENELGARLLIRSNRFLGLTPAGEILLQCARQVFAKLEQARKMVSDCDGGGHSRIVLTADAAACRILLPGVLKEFNRHFDGIELSIVSASPRQAMEKLVAHEADLMLGPAQYALRNHAIGTLAVGSDDLGALAPRSVPVSSHEYIGLEQLGGHNLILPPSSHEDYSGLREMLLEDGIVARVLLETDSVELACTMAHEGFGIAIAPRWCLRNLPGPARMMALRSPRGRLSRDWALMFPAAGTQSSAISELMEICVKRLPALLAADAQPSADSRNLAAAS